MNQSEESKNSRKNYSGVYLNPIFIFFLRLDLNLLSIRGWVHLQKEKNIGRIDKKWSQKSFAILKHLQEKKKVYVVEEKQITRQTHKDCGDVTPRKWTAKRICHHRHLKDVFSLSFVPFDTLLLLHIHTEKYLRRREGFGKQNWKIPIMWLFRRWMIKMKTFRIDAIAILFTGGRKRRNYRRKLFRLVTVHRQITFLCATFLLLLRRLLLSYFLCFEKHSKK